MADLGSFKVPSMVPQDLALIMSLVDVPESTPILPQKGELVRGHKRKGSPNIVAVDTNETDTDKSSTCTESEDEVEAQIVVPLKADGTVKRTALSSVKSSPNTKDEDEDSSSSDSSSSSSIHRRKQTSKRIASSSGHVDIDEDGAPTIVSYLPTAHELPPTAIPVPPLPDPSTLPQEALELVGEIVTILPDSITVRGGGLAGSTARERRDAVLDEGSLLLLEDRTPLGYVWETFGPTTLPHYLVRVKRIESTINTSHPSNLPTDHPLEPVQDQSSETETNSQSVSYLKTSSASSSPDFSKLLVAQNIYHIPSLSKFVFPNLLARLKGSDASNIHDEEPDEYELDFSDDEAEAAHKRLRRGSVSRAPSQTPGTFDDEGNNALSNMGDDVNSLYGASPYDYDDASLPSRESHVVLPSPSGSDSQGGSSLLTNFEDAAVRDALMLARNSRNRRRSSISTQGSTVPGPSQTHGEDHQFHSRGSRGGRGRGKDRRRSERGRERNFKGQPRGRDRGRGRGAPPERHDQGSSFSFEEYDPHMPRPPSPTSLAIARAIGQWADGTPFPYGSTADGGGTANGLDLHTGQPGHIPPHYNPGTYPSQGHYESTTNFPHALGYQQLHTANYGVAPHINPRFAQVFGLQSSTQTPLITAQNLAFPPGSSDPTHHFNPQSEPTESKPDGQFDK